MASSRTTVYLFAGDSLTEGLHGISYVERIAQALAEGRGGLRGQAVNAGRRGDTARALLARIDEPLRQSHPQWVILAVGSNDVWLPWLSGRSLGWWLWLRYRRLRHGVTPTTDLDAFAAVYRALIDRARTVAGARVLACTVSPLGEDLASPVNRQVARLNGAIKRVATDCQVPVADVWQAFVGELAPLRQPSRLLPRWSWSAWWDRRCLRIMLPDEISRRRHLQLTYDGIHLNRRGADLWAAAVLVALAREERSWRAADE